LKYSDTTPPTVTVSSGNRYSGQPIATEAEFTFDFDEDVRTLDINAFTLSNCTSPGLVASSAKKYVLTCAPNSGKLITAKLAGKSFQDLAGNWNTQLGSFSLYSCKSENGLFL
jgi:hypothetical protein